MFAGKKTRTVLTGMALTGLALASTQGLALAGPATDGPTRAGKDGKTSPVATIMDHTARSLALSLADPAWRGQVAQAVTGGRQAGLRDLVAASRSEAAAGFGNQADQADRAVAQAKGLGGYAGSLVEVGLAGKNLGTAASTGAWVAAAPSDDDATSVVAYDSEGAAHRLSLARAPERPVFVVDVDGDKAVAAGLKVLKRELAADGVNSPDTYPDTVRPAATTATSSGYWTTRVTSVSVADDEEPWIKGDAEMFSLVTGFGLDGNARVDTVDMPYLNDEDVTYYPNQILVNWSLYKYNLADVVMYEDDGDTNYADLAKALATALLTVLDQGTYIPLVGPLIDAMPASWWTDDPDYVDSWYTLATDTTGTRTGAAGNGTMSFDRYFVSAL